MAGANLPPGTLMRIVKEIKGLAASPPEGVHFIPHDTMGEVVADIDGPEDTPYFGGKFRVKLVLGDEYPSAPPKGYFMTKIFHPNISDGGDICVNTLKRDWKTSNSLSHVLQVIRCLLIVPFPESSLNDDAGRLFMDSYDDYAKKASLLTKIHAMDSQGLGAAPSVAAGAAGAATPSCSAAASSVEALPAEARGAGKAPSSPLHGGALLESAPKKAKRSGTSKRAAGSKSSKRKGLKRL